jgi:hypothetical protein
MSSGEISAGVDSERGRRERRGVEDAERGGRGDLAARSGRCILPGKGTIRGSSTTRAAYSSAMRWREVEEAERRASRTEFTRCS